MDSRVLVLHGRKQIPGLTLSLGNLLIPASVLTDFLLQSCSWFPVHSGSSLKASTGLHARPSTAWPRPPP